ncbi:MAG: RluA family pseudouridine synthase [Candidatus Melainabacteria bacterium]|nr:RluA family pseudouridine synthase [Candidatus Melainabacteria bacterium]
MNEEDLEIIFETQADLPQHPRLDQFLAYELPEHSRAYLQKLIDQELAWVNGKTAKASQKLKSGDIITLNVPQPVPLSVEAENIGLDIVFEDKNMLVINKPAGMITHPGAGVASGTLVNAVMYHCGSELSGISGTMRPGIVHRLDKDTSGLIMVAKNDTAHQSLAAQIAAKTARRTYLAILEGHLKIKEGVVDKPIGRNPKDRKSMAITQTGKRAVTRYKVLQDFAKYSLVECDLETGRTHQIRVHMAHFQTPVVGDLVYNNKTTGNLAKRAKLGLRGHALHAYKLAFTHPVTQELIELQAEPPEDFANLLSSLKSQNKSGKAEGPNL